MRGRDATTSTAFLVKRLTPSVEILVVQLKPLPSWLLAGSKGEICKPLRPWPAESKPQPRNATLSSTHIAPLLPPSWTSGKNPSLCKQGHRKASTLICYQFSFSSSATWLVPQPGGGSWPDSSPFLLYLFSLANFSSPTA